MNFIGDSNMLEIHKSIVVDENQKPIAIQIPFDEFQRIEEVIENFGLAKLMAETEHAFLCRQGQPAGTGQTSSLSGKSPRRQHKWSILAV